ncbi:hypothetical protein J6590_041111 [Homalodisca vitripennis]|nr:hypothetical protein J6590_041111 [Homalodisca vitripennis]
MSFLSSPSPSPTSFPRSEKQTDCREQYSQCPHPRDPDSSVGLGCVAEMEAGHRRPQRCCRNPAQESETGLQKHKD